MNRNHKNNTGAVPGLNFFIGVFLLSSSLLSFEILASRISSIIFIYNYAFMVVSLAILGLGCGGIYVFYRWRKHKLVRPYREFSLYSGLFAVSVALFIILIAGIYFIPNKFFYFLFLFPPFFFAGVVLSLAFRAFAGESFKLYGTDLLGAASGALFAIWILNTLGGVNGVLLLSILGSLSSLFFWRERVKPSVGGTLPFALLLTFALLFFLNISFSFLGEIPIGNYPSKDMYNMLTNAYLKAEIVETRWSAFGRTDLVKFRDYDQAMYLFVDGAAGTAMLKFNGDLEAPGKDIEEFEKDFVGFFPFRFLKNDEKNRMLVIGPGGGKEILLGLLTGMKKITGVEVNKGFVDIVKEYSEYNGGIYTKFRNVDIVVGEGRSFLRGSDKKYDVIMLTLPVTKSSRSLEGYALTENYLLTAEAIKDYFNHLTDKGRIVLVLHRPHEILRFVVTALTALKEMGIDNKEAMQRIYTIGRKMKPLVVLKKTPFTPQEMNLRHKFMHELNLDYPPSSYLPYIEQQTVVLENKKGKLPFTLKMFNETLMKLAEGDSSLNDVIAASPIDLTPVRDNKPFFYKIEKGLPKDMRSLLRLVVLVNVLLIIVPIVFNRKKKNVLRFLGIFTLLGAGFMLVEISFFQKLTLYLGSPTISLAVLLSSLLVGMGAGSFVSRKFYPYRLRKRLKVFSLGVFSLVILLFFVHSVILNNLLGSSIFVRSFVTSLLLLPLGFVLGVPFPTAITLLKKMNMEHSIPWMYGINGTMSVLGSVLAVALSLVSGFSTALLIGAFCYLIIVFLA